VQTCALPISPTSLSDAYTDPTGPSPRTTHTTRLRAAPTRNPATESTLSRTVPVLSVSRSQMPQYLATIQNPPSLTCEAKMEPAEVAMMTSATTARACSPSASSGATMPAVVTMATVAEPWATRSTTEIRYDRTITGRPTSLNVSERAWATPLALRTAPKTPPAPTTSRMLPTGFSEDVETVSRDLR